MTINDLIAQAHATAKDKGFWDRPREDGTLLMLIVSEVAEAMEELRNADTNEALYIEHNSGKPCGVLSELADVVIRAADLCGAKGWDLQSAIEQKLAFNAGRSRLHGGKRF